jgi:hypothetical protein
MWKRSRLRCGQWAGRPARCRSRTPRDGFPITGFLVTRVPVIGTPLRAITHPRSLAHAQSGLDLRPVFSTLGYPASISARLRPRLFLRPCPLVCRPHVSLSQALPWAFASLRPGSGQAWGIPPTRAYGLASSFTRSSRFGYTQCDRT